MVDKQTLKCYIGKVCPILLGIFFLVSAFAKSFDMYQFVMKVSEYGFPKLHFVAPLVVSIEYLLGVSLIFNIRLKWVSIIGIVFISFLTLVFLYGWFFKDIQDCGCFGHLSFMSTSPLLSLIRNGAIIVLFALILWSGENSMELSIFVIMAFTLVIGVGEFISGYTYTHSLRRDSTPQEFTPVTQSEYGLDKVIHTSSDSTYLVFLFSYSCPHCINSVGNLILYQSSGVVDKIIGITSTPSAENDIVQSLFPPSTEIHYISKEEMTKLTKEIPTTLLIRNDSIVSIHQGYLPSHYLFTF
jgi:uncharacterized membrane protein YphA (DoxX/SURF4 family)